MLQIDYKKWVIYFCIVACIALCLIGCSPAKKIQKVDDAAEKIESLKARFERERLSISSKAIEDYVKNNPLVCPPIEINLDSLCPPIDCPTNGNTNDYLKDTVIIKGNTQYIRGKVILKPFEDVRKVNILTDSLNALRIINASINTVNAVNELAYNKTIEEKNFDIKKLKGFKWLFWILLALFLVEKVYRFIKKPKVDTYPILKRK